MCCSAPCCKFAPWSRPMWKVDFHGVQIHSNRVMGYRVCQLILCHNIILIGEWQSLRIALGQAKNSIVRNVLKKKIKLTLWWLGPESFPFNECSLNRLFKSKHLISLVQVFQVTSWAWYNGCTERKHLKNNNNHVYRLCWYESRELKT